MPVLMAFFVLILAERGQYISCYCSESNTIALHRLACVAPDGRIGVFDVDTGKRRAEMAHKNNMKHTPTCIAWTDVHSADDGKVHCCSAVLMRLARGILVVRFARFLFGSQY